MTSTPSRPLVNEILAHPAYADTIWKLVPTQEGLLSVAADRGGPLQIKWEVHGNGNVKVVWIMGLGAIMSAWQRQTLYFGHEKEEKYSSLVFDNRGMGKSDKPIMRYSTSELAKDLIELLDHLGWTEERQLHVIGVSMGGMIAQELAYLIPTRISSLNLISTAAQIQNTTTYLENLRTRVMMFVPKSLDRAVIDAGRSLFSDTWLDGPDDASPPTGSTPHVNLPPHGNYRMFKTNYERFAAQEISKRLDTEAFQRKGFMLQAIAAGWHCKSEAQLREIGDQVGRERILVLHGTKDLMISVPHGRRLIEFLKPGNGVVRDGIGHVFMLEEWRWFNDLIEEQIEKGEQLRGK